LEAVHFFFESQFFEFEFRQGVRVWSRAVIFVRDAGFQVGVTVLQGLDAGLQAHVFSCFLFAVLDGSSGRLAPT
jgi:hypothetical protein